MALKWFNKKKNGTEKDPAGREGAADQEPAGDAKTLENGQNPKKRRLKMPVPETKKEKRGFSIDCGGGFPKRGTFSPRTLTSCSPDAASWTRRFWRSWKNA